MDKVKAFTSMDGKFEKNQEKEVIDLQYAVNLEEAVKRI